MGLDMYLEVHRTLTPEEEIDILDRLNITHVGRSEEDDNYGCYISCWSHDPVADRNRKILEAFGLANLMTDRSPSGSIIFRDGSAILGVTAIYWRKANAIHNWFVQNVQNGVDECQLSDPIAAEQLAQLRQLCQTALTAYREGDLELARRKMSPVSGFFFGGTELDEWWAKDMQHTIDGVERLINTLIAQGNSRGLEVRYLSSW